MGISCFFACFWRWCWVGVCKFVFFMEICFYLVWGIAATPTSSASKASTAGHFAATTVAFSAPAATPTSVSASIASPWSRWAVKKRKQNVNFGFKTTWLLAVLPTLECVISQLGHLTALIKFAILSHQRRADLYNRNGRLLASIFHMHVDK